MKLSRYTLHVIFVLTEYYASINQKQHIFECKQFPCCIFAFFISRTILYIGGVWRSNLHRGVCHGSTSMAMETESQPWRSTSITPWPWRERKPKSFYLKIDTNTEERSIELRHDRNSSLEIKKFKTQLLKPKWDRTREIYIKHFSLK